MILDVGDVKALIRDIFIQKVVALMWNGWQGLTEAFLALLYPPRQICPLCEANSPRGDICAACELLLADYAQRPRCDICGVLLVREAINHHCPACLQQRRRFELARSVGPYEGHLKTAIHRLKYQGQHGLAKPLGALIARVAGREPAFRQARALVPVPLSAGRLKQRGFNQSLLLAREAARALDLPVWDKVLVKHKETPPQTGLSGPARLQNLRHAFAVFGAEPVQGKIIIVVDDILTTGATISTVSQVLRQAGATRILVLTVATTRYYGGK